MSIPRLSVVLACTGNATRWDQVLAALGQGCAGVATELVMVSAGDGIPLDSAHARFRDVQTLCLPPDTLVPELWGAGLPLTRGDFVGFTTDQILVGPGWAAALLGALESDVVGAAGPIAPPTRGILTLAAWLVRFSAFGPAGWPATTAARDIPGDNAAYRRTALLGHPDLLSAGFWEVEFHRRFAAEALSLKVVPAARASLVDSDSLKLLLRQRYLHAREFGQSRVQRHSESRLKLLVVAPLVPFRMLGRIAVRAVRERVRPTRWLAALPVVFLLTLCWAAGEAAGALRAGSALPPSRDPPGPPPTW